MEPILTSFEQTRRELEDPPFGIEEQSTPRLPASPRARDDCSTASSHR